MMRCSAHWLLAAAIVAAPGYELHAQPATRPATLALDCRARDVATLTDAEIGPAWLAAHPHRLIARLEPLVGAGAWSAALDSVLVRAREHLGILDDSARAGYVAQLVETERAFEQLLQRSADEQPGFMAATVRPVRWQINQSPTTGAFIIFAGPGQLEVTNAMSSDQRRAVCWPAIGISRLMTIYEAGLRDATVEALNRLAASWEEYVDNSYSQLPWELLVNGLSRSRRKWEPPNYQWILVHPSVGVELAGVSAKNLARVDVAVVEGLGYLRYFSNYTRYVGVSGVATFASDRAVAVGGYLHVWWPQAKIGYVVRPDPNRNRRQSLLVTVDLYDLLTGVPKSLREARNAALGNRTAAAAPPP
jgi:hypothetical protein